ncbi:WD40/YVTN/BNR-like repeat-containing protein [Pseudofulvibacter geojedonensis]|uniref:WD40/YVTN/BNR-like repeat-containing protein n=1 Tax=Pseudofulvibacter geojedonensis TaxID=1123758 RepID=A0ABW3HZ38_9FLAO
MKQILFLSTLSIFFFSCKKEEKKPLKKFISEVSILQEAKIDSVSIRAIEVIDNGVYYAASNGSFGTLSEEGKVGIIGKYVKDSIVPSFRSIAYSGKNLFMLSVSNPALLYRFTKNDKINSFYESDLVYEEYGEKVFYDSMKFWNEKEGIAIGDEINGCMSVIITRDGGATWKKLSCDVLPAMKEGTGAFAASNTNIAIVDDKTWMITGGKESVVLYSPDRGETWSKINTPIIQGGATQGMYSVDFYDDKNGFAIGGAYDKPNDSLANKVRTQDGGKTWKVVASEKTPGYRSCVQYIPNSSAQELVAVGFKGITYSNDAGENWKQLSNEPFYTIRFVNDSIAFAAGKGRISKLLFK